MEPIRFLTLVRSPAEVRHARLMIDSLRDFGGALSQCPIWLYEADAEHAPCDSLVGPGIKVLPLDVPEAIRRYYFGDKVAACAQAEAHASGMRSLIWIDPVCLVTQPPLLFDLGDEFDAALRPVHHKNVGLLAGASLDPFWRGVYETVGVDDSPSTVESFVGTQTLRAYFNSHVFSLNPAVGLLQRWLELFQTLVSDHAYQKAACQDMLHQVFLHQAVWSALLVTMLPADRIRLLPPDYSYPYNLHAQVPEERRAQALNDMVCIAYEERTLDPAQVSDVEIYEPLRSWLDTRTG